ncbi:MAG: hypothetical protein AB1629_03195 [Candidatus Omnitrophota bacterium]
MKKWAIRIVFAIAVAAAINFTWSYFSLLKIAQKLNYDLNMTRARAVQLKIKLDEQIIYNKQLAEDKLVLERDLASAQQEINRSKEAITKLEQDLNGLKIYVSALEHKNTSLNLKIDKLVLAKQQLENQINGLKKEKEELEARFYSISELKKAIKYLKQHPSEQRKYRADTIKSSSDNQGYILKEGKTTYKPNVDIRVLPAP